MKVHLIQIFMTLLMLFFSCSIKAAPSKNTQMLASETITPLSFIEELKDKMMASEPEKCKPLLKELDVVKVKYIGFDEKEHIGIILVHRELSQDVLEIFHALYQYRFPIEYIHPAGNKSNTSMGYNCRSVTNQPGILSQHSYGRAIDINPLINPYVKDNQVIPKEGAPFVDRTLSYKGMITRDSIVYALFVARGWDWGGDWYDVGDYQHFEKRANGEKRNPFGYK